MRTDVPVLETERLVLRGHRPDDLDAYAAMWADESVVRHIGGAKLTREQAWLRILHYRGLWVLLGFGFWIVEDRATGALFGEAGVQEMCRDIRPSLAGTLECGWALVPAARGGGLALEAMQAVIGWAGRTHPATPLSCIINPANVPSLRLAAKLGFAEAARTTYRGADVAVLMKAAGRI